MGRVLWLFIILFPFVFVPGYIKYTIYKFAFLNITVIGLWIYLMIKQLRDKHTLDKPNRAEIYLLLFILMVILSTILSVDINQSLLGAELRYEGFPVLISYASLFFFVSRYVKQEKKLFYLKTIVILAIVSCIYGILQHYKLDFIERLSYQVNWTRSFSFYGNPNFFGSFITLTLPLAMIFYLISEKLPKEIYYFIASSIIFLTLLFSETRSGWLGSFIAYAALFFIVVLKKRELWKKWIYLSLSFLIIFLSVNYMPRNDVITKPITSRIDTTIDQVKDDVNRGGSSRIFIWRESLPLIKDYWLHGSGPDTFGLVFSNNYEENREYINAYVDKAHNEYIQIAVTLGIPALIFYLLFIYEVMKQTFINAFLNQKYKFIYLTLLSAIIGYLVQAFFNISVVVVAPYFWIILGLAYQSNKLETV